MCCGVRFTWPEQMSMKQKLIVKGEMSMKQKLIVKGVWNRRGVGCGGARGN